jgi:hypothetical protein
VLVVWFELLVVELVGVLAAFAVPLLAAGFSVFKIAGIV